MLAECTLGASDVLTLASEGETLDNVPSRQER